MGTKKITLISKSSNERAIVFTGHGKSREIKIFNPLSVFVLVIFNCLYLISISCAAKLPDAPSIETQGTAEATGNIGKTNLFISLYSITNQIKRCKD